MHQPGRNTEGVILERIREKIFEEEDERLKRVAATEEILERSRLYSTDDSN